ncbi:DUF2249 domain-containing protein [SCandidatus Aminicenantes bacterium Aminicenantia_JdfR_composite]|nr:DUF2249 domain-containing protein [SCandidatus Aminicenantes bacterium Aminicenantia_JdfR_composite]MCP2596256.1 DUF2249 domain-containing protein [Candidatus Aminicenantes bacterium AC-335-G13]MCP2597831.1 DUF2249 domain-containing protein [Candidatus Aminicenantes bacterium AC-335-L06]MCP2606139.1 DUF2249 domain-containing protein [Candidatus Aminicenantes bacterium AC-708-I09]
MEEGKEIKIDLRKNTFPESLKSVHERLNSLAPWYTLVTISDFDPDILYKEINFFLPGLWKIEKNITSERVWEAKWKMNPNAPCPCIDERIEYLKNSVQK